MGCAGSRQIEREYDSVQVGFSGAYYPTLELQAEEINEDDFFFIKQRHENEIRDKIIEFSESMDQLIATHYKEIRKWKELKETTEAIEVRPTEKKRGQT